MPALGDEFRSAREARGLTLSDVAEQLHIRSVYLNAIETEDWKAIGAPVYIRGFIRTYARFLGLDGESAIAHYNETVPAERPSQPSVAALTDDDDRSGPSLWAVIAVVVAIGVVGFVGYEWWSYAQGGGEREPVATTTPATQMLSPQAAVPSTPVPSGALPSSAAPEASPQPVPAATGSADGAVGGPHRIVIRLTDRSWLHVSIDGKPLVEGIYPAGTVRTFTGNVADVRAGNAGGVVVSVDGRRAVRLGKDGDVVEQRYTL
jgi:cytoskeletal protein RodZ